MTREQLNKFYEGLKVLKEIYPPHLLLIAFFPIILGFIIDSELSDGRYFIINIVWIPFFTIPSILFRRKIFYRIANLLYYLTGLVEISHWIIIKGPLTLTSIFVIAGTNYQEAIEFLNLKATVWLIVLVPYSILFYYSYRHLPIFHKIKIKPYIVGIVLVFCAGFILENTLHKRLIRKGAPQIIKVMASYIGQKNLYKEAMQAQAPKKIDAHPICINCRQTFVLIIGESCNRNHMSLYGAMRKTNPKLEKRKDLMIYTDMVTHSSNTISSVLSIFSNSNPEPGRNLKNTIDLIDVFYSAGFKTYWISNQSPIGVWENLVTVLAKKSDYCKFINITSSSSFEATLTTSYDSRLFKPFASALNEDVPKKFIVLHLMGSHSSYSKRYPAEFKLFAGSNSKERTIAEYDNSILYNDFVVDSLLNMIAACSSSINNTIASAIYMPDHGENVYDEQDRVGHDYSNVLPKANVEIPFIVWLSPAYLQWAPDKTEIIKSNLNKPYITDDLFHSILDLNAIRSAYFIEEKSIFNNHFDYTRRRFLEDGKEYEKR